MAVLRITEAELARDLHAVLEKVQMGTEVIIEQNSHPVAVLRAPEPCRRKLSEIVASPSEHSTATLDPDFAADVQEFIDSHRETLNTPELAEPAGVVDESVAAAVRRWRRSGSSTAFRWVA